MVCVTLTTAINTVLKPLFNAVVAPVRDFILSDGGKQIFKLLITDIKTSGMTVPIRELLRPFINVLAQVISVQVNHQVTTTCPAPAGKAAADPKIDSLEVSALSVGLAQAADAARISLGNAGARIDACGAVVPGDVKVTVDPKSGKPGDSVNVTGEGFTPKGEATVELVDPSGKVIATVPATAGDDGKLPATKVTVPADAKPGTYTVVVTDKVTGGKGTALLEVTNGGCTCHTPALTVITAKVSVGGTVKFTGKGFSFSKQAVITVTKSPAVKPVAFANEVPVSFAMDAVTEPVLEFAASAVAPITVPVAADGTFAADIVVPKDAELGDYDLVAQGENGDKANGQFTVVAASVDPGGNNPGGNNPGGNANGNGGVNGNGQNGGGVYGAGDLANTGSAAGALAPLALLILIGGAALFFIGRNRKGQKA